MERVLGGTLYLHRSHIRLRNLHLPLTTDYSIPDRLEWRFFVVVGDCEQRTIPSGHAVRFFVAEDKVLEEIFSVAAFDRGILDEASVYLAAFGDGGSHMDL